jgi:hypothetical protein
MESNLLSDNCQNNPTDHTALHDLARQARGHVECGDRNATNAKELVTHEVGIGPSRAYELMKLAGGGTTIENPISIVRLLTDSATVPSAVAFSVWQERWQQRQRSPTGEQFVARALELSPRVIMLLRLAFLESDRRRHILENRGLARVHVFHKRLPMMHRDGWEDRKANSGMAFAWFVWNRAHAGPATINRVSWEIAQ